MNNLNLSKPELFKSRKFWTAIIGLLADVIVAFVPDLEPVRIELITSITVIVGLVIGGYGIEDAAIAFKTGVRNPKYNPPA